MRRSIVWLTLVILAIGFGCDWEASDSENGGTWDDSSSWVNFSGTYSASGESGGVLVTSYGDTDTTVTETLGRTETGRTIYAGVFKKKPVKKSSVEISVPWGTIITDDGSGTLSGNNGATGTIGYDTGRWYFDVGTTTISNNYNMVAVYTYTGNGTVSDSEAGNSGRPIYSLTITQTGNQLVFVDNYGASYSGVITSISVPNGDSSGKSSGQVSANFQVSGTSTSGASVRITGTLTGQYAAAVTSTTTGGAVTTKQSAQFSGRTLDATWLENGRAGDILGTTQDTAINITTNTP